MPYLGSDFPSFRQLDVPLVIRAMTSALLTFGVAMYAEAQELPHAVALPAHTQQPARDAALGRELERALVQQGRVELLPQPALDLEAVQLAIDCVEETPECLSQVAERTGAEIVIAPEVQRSQGSIVLSLLYYDARSRQPPRKVAYKQSGDELGRATFDALPGLLRQLFPPASSGDEATAGAGEPAEGEAAPEGETEAAPPEAATGGRRELPLGPILLGAGGVAAVITGAVFGALMKGTENDYASRTIDSEAAAHSAEDQRANGRRQALIANVAFGVGGAAIAAAGIWLAIELSSDSEPPQAALVPALGKDYAGLSIVGTLGARE